MGNSLGINLDPNQITSTPTGSAPTPPRNGGGFLSILKNRILPMVGPVANRIAAAYGNPEGLMQENYNREMAMRLPGVQLQQEQLAREQAQDPIQTAMMQKTLATTPGSVPEMVSNAMAMEKAKAAYSPIYGQVGGNYGPGTQTGPNEFTPFTAPNPEAQKPAEPPQMFMGGVPETPPAVAGAASPGYMGGNPPAAVAGASAAPPVPDRLPVGAGIHGTVDKKPTYNQQTGQWEYAVRNPITGQQLYGEPAQNPNLPPKSLFAFLGEVGGDPTHPENATADQWTRAAELAFQRNVISQRMQFFTGADGQVEGVPVTSTTTITRGGAPVQGGGVPGPISNAAAPTGGAPAGGSVPNVPAQIPVTPGNATQGKPQVRKPGASFGAPQSTGVVKQSGPVEKAFSDYNSALQRQQTMHQNYEEAIKGGGTAQQAEVSLLMNHIGMTLGAQRGARMNQAVIEEAQNSAPWIKTFVAKYFDFDSKTGDYILNTNGVDIKSGINLTADQMKQMVDLGDQMVDAKKAEWQRQSQGAQGGYNPSKVNLGGGTRDLQQAPPARPKGVPADAVWNPTNRHWEK